MASKDISAPLITFTILENRAIQDFPSKSTMWDSFLPSSGSNDLHEWKQELTARPPEKGLEPGWIGVFAPEERAASSAILLVKLQA
jgi:hypothetical protein